MRKYFLLILVAVIYACDSESPRFELLQSEDTGIDFVNEVIETDSFHILTSEYIYNGAGVGVADLNNDGFQDLILAGNMVSSEIYLNKGNLKFESITQNFEGLSNKYWFCGVTIVDINNDGWQDIYFSATNYLDPELRRNKLWVNQGLNDNSEPYFVEKAAEYGIDDESYSVHAAFLDYDLDGDLDLYVLNNVTNEDFRAVYKKKVLDGSAINNDRFYKNNGNGTFTDATQEAGITIEGFGLGLAIGDVNKDGYPDIYVSNDYITNDLLYINQGDGSFKNSIADYLSYQSKSSMGNDMADVNNDGFTDIFTLDMFPEDYSRKKQTINGNSYVFYLNDEKYGFEHQYVRNMLHYHNGFINQAMIPYSEVGQISGVYQTEWSWSALFADYDNDGDKDLMITNGFPKDVTDMDYSQYKARVYGSLASSKHIISRMPDLEISNFAFENSGPYNFVDQTDDWGMNTPSYSYGAAFVDLDNDGDLDYVVNNMDSLAFVYKNRTIEQSKSKQGALRIQLKGQGSNNMAIGAKIETWIQGEYQFYEHFLSRGYLSSVSPVIHIGVGENKKVDSVRVTWPNQKTVSMMTDIDVNQLITLNEADGKPMNHSNIEPKNYLFAVKKDSTIYHHQQTDHVDFFSQQPLIPHKFSQIGPAMVKGDLNGDSVDDILIGSSDVLPTTVLLKEGNKFVSAKIDGITDAKPTTQPDLLIIDIDRDGDNDIIAISGGYANQEESDYEHFIYMNNSGVFERQKLPIPAFPASVVRAGDVDNDGDLDVFIGARVRKGMFPFAEYSYVLINENGKLNSYPEWKYDLGMVTDMVWSDYDGDGWQDLLITREWNTIAILKNDNGRALDVASIADFQEQHGLWYSITAGDFDNDGDDDYLLGNLGNNHRFTVSQEYPMRLYALDLDNSGTIDPFITSYWQNMVGEMTEYPVNYLDELGAQSAYFRSKFNNYTKFSFATVDEILDEISEEDRAFHFQLTTTSSYLLWNDKGSLTWEKLPVALQLSPLTTTVVQDVNGDDYPDILLGGNDYSYDVSTGYYDANKGFVMLSNGPEQSFQILTASESGLLLQGQVGSLLYFEGDTALVVAGFNRDNTLIFEQLSK